MAKVLGQIEYRNADGTIKYVEEARSHYSAIDFGAYITAYHGYTEISKQVFGCNWQYTYRNDAATVNGATIIVCGPR